MKKIVSIGLFLFIANIVMGQNPTAGKVRAYFAGFNCVSSTWDDAMQLDGKGDEVFLNINMTVADAQGNTRTNKVYRTGTYGDATGAFSNRINTGSSVDLFGGAKGGLKDGDLYRCNHLIGEFDMGAQDVLTLIPVIYEWDQGGPDAAGVISNDLNSRMSDINKKVVSISSTSTGVLSNTQPLTKVVGNASEFLLKSELNFDYGYDGILETLFGKNGTRPIGVSRKDPDIGKFRPQFAILPTPLLQKITTTNFGAGPGLIPIAYDEPSMNNSQYRGHYIVWIRLEFVPQVQTYIPVASSTPKAVSGTVVGTRNITKTATFETPQLPSLIVGTWEGTRGFGTAETPEYFSFQFNADHTLWLLSSNTKGQVVSKGAYSVNQNSFEATYTLANGTVASISGTYGNQRLTGNWKETNNKNISSGKWVMYKK